MAYSATTRRALVRPSSGGTTMKEVWPTDAAFIDLMYTGLIDGQVGGSAPVSTSKLWLDTSGGLDTPAVWKYHNGTAWVATAGTTGVAAHISGRGGPSAGDKGDVVVLAGGAWELDVIASAARIAASATAMDSISDALQFDELGVTQKANIVSAVAADIAVANKAPTFLTPEAASGAAASVSIDCGTGPMVVHIDALGLNCGAGTVSVQFSLDGGATWRTIATAAATTTNLSYVLSIPIAGTNQFAFLYGSSHNIVAGSAGAGTPTTYANTNSGNRLFRVSASAGNINYQAIRVAVHK